MAQALVNPEILSWARDRAGLSLSVLAKKMRVNEARLSAWESGEQKPTFKQARKLANKVYIPFGFLFLPKPPEENLMLPDLRTVGSHEHNDFSVDLKDTINDVITRQQWYQEYIQNQGIDNSIAYGRASLNDSVSTIVEDMRKLLEIAPYPQRGSWEDYFRDLIKRIEKLGVLVMRNSMVGSNTHRPLSVGEFRGFAISDKSTSVIFINTADSPGARLFTLIHELTHIWLGYSGVSDAEPENHRKEEQLCNAVAAEFLVPADEFTALWVHNDDWGKNLPTLEAHFRVSQWVIARRAETLNFIELAEYQRFVKERLEAFKNRKRGEGTPPYSRLQKGRVSESFAFAVAGEALSGRMLLRDAARLIGISPHRISDFSRKELGF